MTTAPVALEVRDLVTRFYTDSGTVHAVSGISYSLRPGESIAIVGESGSGKTVQALSLMGLVQGPSGVVEGGRILLGGRDVTKLSTKDWQRVRGKEIAMIFQDPMTSLNPVLTIGRQIGEVLAQHLEMDDRAAAARTVELLEMVGIAGAASRLRDFPHQLSGGQRQRVMIAMALACEPSVLIADEPTTALDVTIQAQIVELIRDLQRRMGMAIVWITHDLGLVAGLVDRVLVMYAGRLVEVGRTADLFAGPAHPYTIGLLGSIPLMDGGARRRLVPIEGSPPDMTRPAEGCPFAPRCPFVLDRCHEARPGLQIAGPHHQSACWRVDELPALRDRRP